MTHPTPPAAASDFAIYRRIAHLIGSIYFAGDFKAETVNERDLESLLKQTGHRYASWDEIITGEDALNEAATPPIAQQGGGEERRVFIEGYMEAAHRHVHGSTPISAMEHHARLAADKAGYLTRPAPAGGDAGGG